MEKIEARRLQLHETYTQYQNELRQVCPQLVMPGYSHPYYLHIPDQWFERKYRILIVGEEGYGEKLHDVSIQNAQAFNKEYMESQLGRPSAYKRNGSAFWNRSRRMQALFCEEEFSMTSSLSGSSLSGVLYASITIFVIGMKMDVHYSKR